MQILIDPIYSYALNPVNPSSVKSPSHKTRYLVMKFDKALSNEIPIQAQQAIYLYTRPIKSQSIKAQKPHTPLQNPKNKCKHK